MFHDSYSPTSIVLPSQTASAPVHGASLGSIVDRIIEAVDAETASLRAGGQFDIKASNARKSRCLYDLSRALKTVSLRDVGAADRARIETMRARLDANALAIKAHMSAVGEIADLVQEAIERTENDGTYSSSVFGAYRAA